MGGSNHFAVGAVVRVEIGGTSMMRIITAGMSTLGQQPAEAFFGTGRARRARIVTVEWPDGRTTVLENVPTGRVVTITDQCDESGRGRRPELEHGWRGRLRRCEPRHLPSSGGRPRDHGDRVTGGAR